MKYLPIIVAALLILAACAAPEDETKELAEQLKEEAKEAEEQEEPAEEPAEEPMEEPVEEPAEEPAEPEKVEEPAKPEEKVEEPKPEETMEQEETTVSPPKPQTGMQRFLDVFAEKVESYEFIYKRDFYFVREMKFKVILAAPATVKGVSFAKVNKSLFYYDTIYVDRKAKEATAYCEGHSTQVNQQCAQLDLYDLPLPVSFEEYNIVLPEDWLFSYLNKYPSEMDFNKYYIEGRTTAFVKFEEDPVVELSIDPGTGLILRADQKKDDQIIARYNYEKLGINGVRDVDVMHRSKSEIPSEETFFR